MTFGILVWRVWNTPNALARRRQQRWYGWWIALCVALHFIPLALVFGDPSYYVLTAVQVIGLLWMRPELKRGEYATSRWACSWIALTFLLCAAVSAVIFLSKHGYPF